MKKIVLLLSAITLLRSAQAQVTSVQIDMGAGYADQVYYNFSGTKTTVSQNTWDIGFCTTLMDAGIISNPNNVIVYKVANADSSAYASIVDTVGLIREVQYNSDTNWFKGAFNVNANPGNPFDFGWGIYDYTAHSVFGDTLYIVNKGTDWYKFWIRAKTGSGDYYVRYTKLNGGADVDLIVTGASYATKNFVYLNLETPAILDFEPASTDWHFLFTHYITEIPGLGPYPVTGALNNVIRLPLSGPIGTQVAEARHVDLGSISYTDYENDYSTNISEVGYDWKTFVPPYGPYVIEDSLIYFVKTPVGSIYSLKFTDFNSTDGITSFETEQLLTGINSVQGDIINATVYPNPASDQATIVYDAKKNTDVTAILYDVTGREVVRNEFGASTGLNTENVRLPKLN